ncbi:hypothetical protein BDV98DRAFT_591947 [Pterulicium gracile]|uniref:DUF6534 domain-containing protein n=1 Tax=Pterulicium gracile TaxID=1884261 RepID=A0A5C3QMM7_9AGAR|nr:hypothetical protein BDV98DRAFT_591947 [Pterula gracilis]
MADVCAPFLFPNALSITHIAGPLLLGYMLGYALFGALCVQFFVYCVAFRRDPTWLRLFVWGVFLLELTLVVLFSIGSWWSFVDGFADVSHLTTLDPTSPAQPPLSGLVATLFHGFYSWRVYQLSPSKSLLFPSLIMLISIAQLVMSLLIGINLARQEERIFALDSINAIVTTWLSGSAVANVMITGTLGYVLLKASRTTGLQQRTSRLQRAITFLVETGLLTSCVAIIQFVLFLTKEKTFFYFLLFFYLMAKLYSNTLLATLNSRVLLMMHTENPGPVTRNQLENALWSDIPAPRPSSFVGGIVVTRSLATVRDGSEVGVEAKSPLSADRFTYASHELETFQPLVQARTRSGHNHLQAPRDRYCKAEGW